ncbi:MAG: hypothetical protein OXC40_04185 [Proteobacteria bacterium]|nr:hypothetical protein [Pseudomonadota bacterium]
MKRVLRAGQDWQQNLVIRLPPLVPLLLIVSCVLGCELWSLHGQKVITVDRGLTIGLIPMWIPQGLGKQDQSTDDSVIHSVDYMGPSLFDNWLFRRERISYLNTILPMSSVDIALMMQLVAQPFPGGYSELSLLQYGRSFCESWQNVSVPSTQIELSSSFVIRPSRNLIKDAQVPPQLVLLNYGDEDNRDQWNDYLVFVGYIYKKQPILLVMIYVRDDGFLTERFSVATKIIKEFLQKNPGYCTKRLIVAGQIPDPLEGERESSDWQMLTDSFELMDTFSRDLPCLPASQTVYEHQLGRKDGVTKAELGRCLTDDLRNPIQLSAGELKGSGRYQKILVPKEAKLRASELWLTDGISSQIGSDHETKMPFFASYGWKVEISHLPLCSL